MWLGFTAYALLGALYSIEAAARLDGGNGGEHDWDNQDYALVTVAALVWPLAILAMLWYWAFEWRAEKIRERVQDAAE